MIGYIYFLTNPSMPGLIKIGYSEQSVESRINQLSTTGVPTKFRLMAQFLVVDCIETESVIHKSLERKRINAQREFFACDLKEALDKSLPVILSNISSVNEFDSEPVVENVLNISKFQILLLLILLNERLIGYEISQIKRNGLEDFHEIVIERELETLRQLNFLALRKNRDRWMEDNWQITSQGVKVLFDIGALNKDGTQSDKYDFADLNESQPKTEDEVQLRKAMDELIRGN